VFRRVRLGHRDGGRPSAWAGPPPLLLAATVLGLLVAPAVADDPPAALGPSVAVFTAHRSARTVEPRTLRPTVVPVARGAQAAAGIAPVRLAPSDTGVATMNLYRKQPRRSAAADVRRLTARSDVDVVGWQEADRFPGILHDVPGWTTKTFRRGKDVTELATSWRSSEFRLLSSRLRRVALGLSWREGRYPFDTRLVAVVRLEHRATGRVLTVLNTHLPQRIENRDRPGRWLSTINSIRARAQLKRIAEIWEHTEGRWVIGTGDFNFGARADAHERPTGGPVRALRGVAVSSYQKLGIGIGPTHPPTARNIDYVWVDRSALRNDLIAFRWHGALIGYHSDHRPLLALVRLS
jgi:endonuclease/exonuclease/phosphatase family metal-dependent hydrolase